MIEEQNHQLKLNFINVQNRYQISDTPQPCRKTDKLSIALKLLKIPIDNSASVLFLHIEALTRIAIS